jgi:hypothetical protein
MQARETGANPSPIEEYSALRKSIETDKNLRVILKNPAARTLRERKSPATNCPLSAGPDQRSLPMNSGFIINGKFTARDMNPNPVPAAGSVRIFK